MENRAAIRIPVITIGGYLGAGKTTLVNYLLSQSPGQRIVVFVNDFGSVNIDHDLIETVKEDRISLKNGCICCTLNEDLISQMAEFTVGNNRADLIVIEASGIADPKAIESSIYTLESAGQVVLDMRAYVIDAENFDLLSYEDSETVIDHAATSDLIILNKTDTADAAKLEKISETLRISAPYGCLIETEFCNIGSLLNLRKITASRDGDNQVIRLGSSRKEHPNNEFAQWSLSCDHRLDRAKFKDFVTILPSLCWRAKGIIRFSDNFDRYYVFHFVGHRASLELMTGAPDQSLTQFVAIGETSKFDKDTIEEKFRDTLVGAPNQGSIESVGSPLNDNIVDHGTNSGRELYVGE